MPFILAPIALTPKTETILLSEPEAHLHPKAQSDLAEIFIKVWQKEQKQFLIETHSEHILTAFLNAVAKGKLSKNDFSIYYFENQNGTACAPVPSFAKRVLSVFIKIFLPGTSSVVSFAFKIPCIQSEISAFVFSS